MPQIYFCRVWLSSGTSGQVTLLVAATCKKHAKTEARRRAKEYGNGVDDIIVLPIDEVDGYQVVLQGK